MIRSSKDGDLVFSGEFEKKFMCLDCEKNFSMHENNY